MTAELPSDAPCPCGSGRTLDACCGPYVAGQAQPPTAEALMRSRYAAYALGDMEHLGRTLGPEERKDFDPEAVARWNRNVRWTGLTIHDLKDGAAGDERGEVEFTARFQRKGAPGEIHERSAFSRHQGGWVYSGQLPTSHQEQAQPVRSAKTGRNEPCPCGSKKKYKKCCGA